MKKLFFLLLVLIGFTFSLSAQNLISNPSFESTYSNCGTASMGDIYFNDNFDSISTFWSNFCLVKSWMTMEEDPDIYSLGSSYFKLPISERYCKYIYPHYGSNIAGGVQYAETDSLSNEKNLREVLENKLLDSLKRGHKYKLSFYVQLFDSIPISVLGAGKILGINSFSAYFSNIVLNYQYHLPMGIYQPQIQIDTMVTDTQHWVLLVDTFTAKGGERYMAVGNFKPDSLTQSQLVDSVRAGSGFSYYFYDDFSLIDLTPDGVEEVGVGKLEVYPNPCEGKLFVTGYELLVNTLEVTNLLGQKQSVIIEKLTTDNCKLNTEHLPLGIYFIKATDTKGNVKVGKFVKE